MRRLIGLLLALNLGALLAGWAMQHVGQRDPSSMGFNADRINVLRLLAPEPARVAAVPDVTDEPVPASPAPGDTAIDDCLAWPRLDGRGMELVERRLREAGASVEHYDVRVRRELGWWVYVPPIADDAARQARIEALRALGITDLAPVRAGAMVHALSLGVFPTLARARAHAAALRAKGVDDARYAPRPNAGEVQLILMPAIDAATRAALASGWPEGLTPGRCAPLFDPGVASAR